MTADGQIKSFFQRWENLEAEKKQTADALKDLFAEAKGFGYDTKALRAAFRLKVKEDLDNPADAEFEAVVDTYLNAINAPSISTRDARLRTRENIEKFDPETGEILEDINPRLAQQIVDGMQAEAGRAALVTAVDILIEQEEAKEFQAKASGDNGATVHGEDDPADSVTGDASRSSRGDDSPASNFGTIELMHQQIAAARAREIASASQGEAEAPSAERVTPQGSGSAAANTGGDHVTAHYPAATSAGAIVKQAPAISKYRPHCQRPEMCGSGTRDHCWSCKQAMREGDAA
ncbi:DUF2312 domain-containing protein [Rhizobium sp. CNPSo 3968]|uniref:DUF2312 domain-containing protein n=1 Tax=Rhizobium sp. CNPSo 3968 TaxID=3021408 RepID=UPI00254D06CC|nr:GapR family DNA-binding domain-containing protein [Rhizobium sp. CNPSo 3968]MDK4720098.1 DUF2312 domain-containing protein [Rhizobium sp. CNPSo 3968]